MIYDCSIVCVDAATATLFIGDSVCDDGSYGYDLDCETFSDDEGDCEAPEFDSESWDTGLFWDTGFWSGFDDTGSWGIDTLSPGDSCDFFSAPGIVSCDGYCLPEEFFSDGICDSDLDCATLFDDGGDCATEIGDSCTDFEGADGVIDCYGDCSPLDWFGDDFCDADFDCTELGEDAGDCVDPGTDADDDGYPTGDVEIPRPYFLRLGDDGAGWGGGGMIFYEEVTPDLWGYLDFSSPAGLIETEYLCDGGTCKGYKPAPGATVDLLWDPYSEASSLSVLYLDGDYSTASFEIFKKEDWSASYEWEVIWPTGSVEAMTWYPAVSEAGVWTVSDCDDSDPDVHPFADEVFGDGVDNDCDGMIDDGTWTDPVEEPPDEEVERTKPEACADVFVVIFSGHNDGTERSYLAEPPSMVPDLITHLEGLVERVETSYLVDSYYNLGYLSTYKGYAHAYNQLNSIERACIADFSNPTKVVVIAHSHGTVWAHKLVDEFNSIEPGIHGHGRVEVELLIDLDGYSALWNTLHWDKPSEFPPEVHFTMGPWPVDQANNYFTVAGLDGYQDIEDIVPENVVKNLEYQAAGGWLGDKGHGTHTKGLVGDHVRDSDDNHRWDGTRYNIVTEVSGYDHGNIWQDHNVRTKLGIKNAFDDAFSTGDD